MAKIKILRGPIFTLIKVIVSVQNAELFMFVFNVSSIIISL